MKFLRSLFFLLLIAGISKAQPPGSKKLNPTPKGQASLPNQPLVSKKGEPYLPEEKDCALTIDATPFLEYTGKLLSGAGSTAPTAAFPANFPMTITAKYFKNPNYAYRFRARVGTLSQTYRNTVIDNAQTAADTLYTTDSKRVRGTNITLSAGFEKRRGKTRLQGYYGAEAVLSFSSSSVDYTYGNAFTNTQTSVYTTDFEQPSATGFASSLKSNRPGATKNGSVIGLGARAFGGIEYFILPKISLGIELGWGITYKIGNDGFVRNEYWDNVGGSTRQRQITKSGGTYLGIDTDNSGGQLLLNFYF